MMMSKSNFMLASQRDECMQELTDLCEAVKNYKTREEQAKVQHKAVVDSRNQEILDLKEVIHK